MNALGKYPKEVLATYLNCPWLPQGAALALLLGRDLPWPGGQLLQNRNHHCLLWVLESTPLGLSFHVCSELVTKSILRRNLSFPLGFNLQTRHCFCPSTEIECGPLCSTASSRHGDETLGCDERRNKKPIFLYLGQRGNQDEEGFLSSPLQVADDQGLMALGPRCEPAPQRPFSKNTCSNYKSITGFSVSVFRTVVVFLREKPRMCPNKHET